MTSTKRRVPTVRWRVASRTSLVLLIALLFVVAVAGVPPWSVGAQDTPLQPYKMVDQWPSLSAPEAGELRRPISMDMAPDGTVFISDPDAGGVHRMLPNGQFAEMIGAKGSGGGELVEPGLLAVGPAPEPDDVRLYVVDPADDRVVIYNLGGRAVDVWQSVFGAVAISADADGTVFIADAFAGWVRAFNDKGRRLYSWGQLGTGAGEFDKFTGISVLPGGEAIAVGDLDGDRVQVFDLPPTDGITEPTVRHVFDLTEPKYGGCRGGVVNLVSRDSVWVGEGVHACQVMESGSLPMIAPGALNDTICRRTVRLPRVRQDTDQYFALALSDPSPGKCGEKQGELPTTVVVVSYDDLEMSEVAQVWTAGGRSELSGMRLLAPSRISRAGPELLLVRDESPYASYFRGDGRYQSSTMRTAIAWAGGEPSYDVRLVTATDTVGEFLAYYEYQEWISHVSRYEYGVGRFKESQKYVAGDLVYFVEPVWRHVILDDARIWGRHGPELDLVYNPVSDEAVLLYNRPDPRSGEQMPARMRRIAAADGVLAARGDVELPYDLAERMFSDLGVGLDGRMYALEALADKVLVFDSMGEHIAEVPVAVDAHRVSGGPKGELFVLRSSGSVERLDMSGTVTARFDARPLPDAEPSLLNDMVAMDDGRVYVSHGQVGVVSAFAAADDGDVPVPEDETCTLRGDKVAAPVSVAVGQPVTVTLGIDGRCGVSESPSDIMLIVPADDIEEIAEITRLFTYLDFSKHRVGMVTYLDKPRLEFDLTHDKVRFVEGVVAASRHHWPGRPGQPLELGPHFGPAVLFAHEHLPKNEDRRRVMMLFRPDDAMPPGQHVRWPSEYPGPEIEFVAADGVHIVEYTGGHRYAMEPEDYVKTPEHAGRRMVEFREAAELATQFDLVDTLGSAMALQPDSLEPPGTVADRTVRWSAASLPHGRSTFALQVVPQSPGRHATNTSAVTTFVDGWGQPGRIELPVPVIDVEEAPPTATPAPTEEPTAMPTTSSPMRTLFVPLAHNGSD